MRRLRTIVAVLLAMVLLLPSSLGTVAANTLETGSEVRNIALLRAAYQSSYANFNNTSQLTTDGLYTPAIAEPIGPVITQRWTDSPTDEEAQHAFDGLSTTKYLCRHPQTWVQYQFPDGKKYAISSYAITTANDQANRNPRNWTLYGVTDDDELEIVDTQTAQLSGLSPYTVRTFNTTENLTKAYKAYRFDVAANNGNSEGSYGGMIQFAELDLRDADGNSVITKYTVTNEFKSYWQSAGSGSEWIYIDLGGESQISQVKLFWGNTNFARSYDIQVSNDAKNWNTVYTTTEGDGGDDIISLPTVAVGQYIRLLTKTCQGNAYALNEFEVYGTNDVVIDIGSQPPEEADGRKQFLTGGNWKLQRATEVDATGAQISSATVAFNDSDWIPATVPGTVLVSYLNNGALPDPNFADYSFNISESYFLSDFWYRDSFTIPKSKEGQKIWLNFNNINWKADIYFNGEQVGRIEGAFLRGKFDVTKLANYDGENVVAVYIYKNDTPGTVHNRTIESTGGNGGVLGADNPTSHASVGWDWVPTIRGRNIGIYGDVFLSYSGTVQLADPWIETHLKAVNDSTAYNAAIDPSTGYLTFRTEVTNSTENPVDATVSGTIMPGNISYSKAVTVPANGKADVVIDDIVIQNPNLWWPNRYGDQFLYVNETKLVIDEQISDIKEFKVGVREMRYRPSSQFNIYVNGARIYCSGGNWGMDESMLRCNDEEGYDIRVRLHKEAGFTMIRNWVGMTGNEEFYNACDKYGILIMDDFWLANPGDGPNPNNEDMFMVNAIDKIKWVRKHPSLAFYCGRNEGNPPTTLNNRLVAATTEYDGSRYYVPHSASGQLSGFGPYTAQGPAYYFSNANTNFHSERGMPNVPALESVKKMIPEADLWPVPNFMWAYHDFTTGGAQNGAQFMSLMRQFGDAQNVEDFVQYAQMVNYENHKALFEGPQIAKGNAMLMWMSQSAWPSMVWQTYDYFFDTNGGFFGIKRANQPVNALFNSANNTIVVSNNSGKAYTGLSLAVDAYDLYGVKVNSQTIASFDLTADQVMLNATGSAPVTAAMTTTDTNFIVTKIKNSDGEEICDNFYWTTIASPRTFTDMQRLDSVGLDTKSELKNVDGVNFVKATIRNYNDIPAIMIRVKTLTDKTGQQVLPAYYSDNYFSLMPGESKEITIEFDDKYLLGENPEFFVEGYNIPLQPFGAELTKYRIGTPRFVMNGDYITSMNSGEIVLELTVAAFEDSTISVMPIIAVYQNGILYAAQGGKTTAALTGGQDLKLTTPVITIPSGANLEEFSVVGFVWDGNMIPVKAPISLGDWVRPHPNLTLNKPATASSTRTSDGAQTYYGNDGDQATRWTSDYSQPQTFMVDLKGAYQVTKVIMYWEAAFARTFSIEVSDSADGPWTAITPNGATSTTINGVRGGNYPNNAQTIEFEPTAARYLRFNGLTRQLTQYGFSFYEMEAFGTSMSTEIININPIRDRDVAVGESVRLVVSANGSAGTGVSFTAQNLPAGAVLDALTGVFTWTPTAEQIGANAITFTVDNGVMTDAMTVNLTVK